MVQKMWEQRLLDMDDPKKGWVQYDVNESNVTEIAANESSSSNTGSDDEWIDITLKNRKAEIEQFENRATLNFGILWAIIELVFKYFYEGFQFSLVKLALQATPEVITQAANTEWQIPKRNRVPFVKPKIEKPKPVKVKQEKVKREKPQKPKKAAKEKKPPQKKAPAMSTEEKKRLEKERLELLKLEEAKRIAEENKRYMYPLADGVTDEFFMGIFENWERPKRKK
ncbi:hypothetical protein PPYR_12256 [Photinus pyralis]|nr:hypothetical protein PPYR_12256 [Photinus pyralis]